MLELFETQCSIYVCDSEFSHFLLLLLLFYGLTSILFKLRMLTCIKDTDRLTDWSDLPPETIQKSVLGFVNLCRLTLTQHGGHFKYSMY